MTRQLRLATIALLLTASTASAQSTVFAVRHAERADSAAGAAPSMGADPDLSAAGRVRAASLATTLKDAGITAIYVTEYKRTQQTAAPLAAALGLQVITIPAKDAAALVTRVKASAGNVLVVGHSNTIPDLLKGLGVATPVTIEDAEYDSLFVVARGEKPGVVRLRYR